MPDSGITLEEAKTHLRIRSPGFDDEVTNKLEAAIEWCEGHCSRTFRISQQRTIILNGWWCNELGLKYPPLLSVDAINYYLDDADILLDDSNYRVITSVDGVGWIEWTANAVQPDHDERSDAIRITYTSGYETQIPYVAKAAILEKLTLLQQDGKGPDLDRAERTLKMLLPKSEWGDYA